MRKFSFVSFYTIMMDKKYQNFAYKSILEFFDVKCMRFNIFDVQFPHLRQNL
jgi:hypothetical protein